MCNLNVMNYLFLEFSIQYFWTVIDWRPKLQKANGAGRASLLISRTSPLYLCTVAPEAYVILGCQCVELFNVEGTLRAGLYGWFAHLLVDVWIVSC